MKPIFLDLFENEDDVFAHFEQKKNGETILFAWYDYGNYAGEAFVLYKKGKKLFEVHGSHCSCMGLENQWEPEKTTIKDLRYRIENGNINYKNELEKFLNELEKSKK